LFLEGSRVVSKDEKKLSRRREMFVAEILSKDEQPNEGRRGYQELELFWVITRSRDHSVWESVNQGNINFGGRGRYIRCS